MGSVALCPAPASFVARLECLGPALSQFMPEVNKLGQRHIRGEPDGEEALNREQLVVILPQIGVADLLPIFAYYKDIFAEPCHNGEEDGVSAFHARSPATLAGCC